MNDKPRNDSEYMEDSYWESLMGVAKDYQEQDDEHIYVYDDEPFVEVKKYETSEEALKVLFGYDSFREGQKSVIDNILQGRDVFAVMPTGAGKSVCYQIPAMLLSGVTLVISPLISLMQDQVKALNEAGVSSAYINSSLSESAYFETVNRVRQGRYKIIYVAPERLTTDSFIELVSIIDIAMITVDEAHCISQWGQDFRPSYMRIVEFVKLLKKRPIISAFTATATEVVREDIVCTLGLEDPYHLVTGFDRENLFFQVDKPKKKDLYILDYIENHLDESGIIYCATRKNVDNLYELLKKKGISVAKYHAGMSAAERKKMQDDFIFDYTSIVVATNAFGMGIDKSNVRFVIHYNMPQSMENYYQEAGRAGRDGMDAKSILLFSPQDVAINRFLLEHKEMLELDEIDKATARERDRQRLQIMERYCYGTECLRNYIRKYFGEKPEKPCDDCGNCTREFETLDMTDAAKQIINCVYEAKGRYGKTIILDTVKGAKTARVGEIGSTNYKTYGVLADTNRNLLNRLMEQLILENYLIVGDYQVIKINDISRLKNPEACVLVKITDYDKLPEKETKAKGEINGVGALTSVGFKLFDHLRALRLEIAREEKMPPYIIFNDKTIIEMAAVVPLEKQEMLKISGVGEHKYYKYGDRFLTLIRECVERFPELLDHKVELKKSKQPKKKTKKKSGKEEFNLLPQEAREFVYKDFYNIQEVRDEMNSICLRDDVKTIPAIRLTECLLKWGLITSSEEKKYYEKVPTEEGLKLGIKITEKLSAKGNTYNVLMYSTEVQKKIVEHYTGEAGNYQSDNRVEAAGRLWKKEEEVRLKKFI